MGRLLIQVFWMAAGLAFPSEAWADAVSEAWGICAQNLALNSCPVRDERVPLGERELLLAGAHQYKTLWARDFSFAVGGALAAGRDTVVRDSLEVLLGFQREDGLLPRVVDNVPIRWRVLLGLFGAPPAFSAPLRGWFETEYGEIALDSNVTVPWAAARYVLGTGDRRFALRWLDAVERALGFIERGYLVDGLVGNQPPFSDWQDNIRRVGRVGLTNALYVLALRGVSEWAGSLGQQEKSRTYAARAEEVGRRFRAFFWDDARGVLRNFEGNEHLSADVNLVAVAYGLLSEQDSRRVLSALRESPLWKPYPGRSVWPDYSSELKGAHIKWAGISGYYDRMHWLWITSLAALAEARVGDCEAYRRILEEAARRIAADGTVYEIFSLRRDGRSLAPVRRLFYRAEEPFTWSSGMFLEAAALQCRTLSSRARP